MIADGSRCIAEGVVRGYDRRPFVKIRLKFSLPHVPRIDEENCASVARARGPQVFHVPTEQCQPSALTCRRRAPVQIPSPNNRHNHSRSRIVPALGCGLTGESMRTKPRGR